MKKTLLSGFACVCLFASSALADLHQGSAWLQGPSSPGFAIAHLDFDDETREVSVLVESQGLSSAVVQGRLVGAGGELLCSLALQASAKEIVFGTATLTPADALQILGCTTRVVLDTTQFPQGEVDGLVATNQASYSFEVSPAQVSPGHPGTSHGIGYAMQGPLGDAAFSGQLFNLQGTIVSIEIRRSAWYGQEGKLLLPVTMIGYPTPSLVTFSAALPAPTYEERRELHDGLCYVIVRTSAYPEGELRGQIRPPTLGDRYCTGRPSSVSMVGASLTFSGSPLASDNEVQLQGFNLPPDKIVVPLVGFGSGHAFSPGGLGGMLCVGGAGIGRLTSYLAPASAQGTFQADLDLSSFSIGGSVHSLQPGMRLNFQLWYRDPLGPTASNFSSAVSVVFH